MGKTFSYRWYIHQYEQAKEKAETFILSVDDAHFLQPPEEGRWCIAECYSHLINYGNLFFDRLAEAIANTQKTTNEPEQAFEPRWLVHKLVSFLEPPYKIKLKTLKVMKPDPVSGYDRLELLDEYVNLQDGLIAQLEKGQHRHVDLGSTKINHPIFSYIKISLSECFALIEAHQRRHQWQAEQTLKALERAHTH